jgi:hypothetical protein
MTMTLKEYADAKRAAAGKVPSSIRQRWQKRVVARNLHQMGAAGAWQYLSDYGRGIAAPKVIHLALQAEAEGCPEMAQGFWAKAYELEMGHAPPDGSAGNPSPSADGPGGPQELPQVDGLPDHLQPGRLSTMQPVDAPEKRGAYLGDPQYWGQPKRDGHRRVVTATIVEAFYQSRSLNLNPAPAVEMDDALKEAALLFGLFVLDGELYYPDALGSEHRTGAQAATVNVEKGFSDVHPQPRLAVFKALYAHERDLTPGPESARIAAGEAIAGWLAEHYPDHFEVVPTARTTEEKHALARRQLDEGREGEVWVQHDCAYTAGKRNGKRPPIVRTKYLTELPAVVISLSRTTAEGRPFGAAEVGAFKDGEIVSLGSIGTGFTQDQMCDLAQRHDENPGKVVIDITTQGFTEKGKVMHGRFLGFSDKVPEACVLQ